MSIHSVADSAKTTASPATAPIWTVSGTPAYWRINIALFMVGFATFSLIYCVQPLLPVFAEVFKQPAERSSLALSLTTGFLAFSIIGAGILSEAVSRKRLMFASMCLAAVFNLLTALAPNWHMLLLFRALEGIAIAGVPAVAMAYLAEEIEPRGLGLAMGLYVSGSAFGGMIGRVATGLIMEWLSWRVAVGAIGMTGIVAAVCFLWLLPPSRNFVQRPGLNARFHLDAWRGHLRNRRLPLLFLVGFLVMGAFITVYNYAGFRLQAPPYLLNQAQIGLIFTVYVFGIVSSSLAGGLADRYGRGPVLIVGVIVTALGLALTLLQALAGIIAGIVVLTIGFFISHSVASSWVGRTATRAKGHAAALYLLAYYLGSSVMGSVGGWFWTHRGWPAVAAFAALLLAIALSIAMYLYRTAGLSGRADRG